MSMIQKQNLTSEELQLLSSEMNKRGKSATTAWLLWLFAAGLGGHRFYLGKTGSGVAMLLTLGGLGVWSFIDLFLLSGMIKTTNDQIESDVISELNLMKNAKKNSEVTETE